MKINKWHIIALLCSILLIAIVIVIFQQNTSLQTNKSQNSLAFIGERLVAIKEGNVYEFTADETWRNLELSEQVKQVFGGENLCFLNEDGSLYYEKDTQQIQEILDEELPLGSAYNLYIVKKALEVNEEEPFVCINQNVDYLGFRALLQNGEILYADGDDFAKYQMEETPIYLSGSYILTEQGNVYYLDTVESKLKCVYESGDIAAINVHPTNDGRCLGLRRNGTVVSLTVSDYDGPLEVGDWKHIVAIQQGFCYAVGLTNKGNVLYIDDNKSKTEAVNKELKKWTDIVDIVVSSSETIVGLKEDGTCFLLNIAELEGE